MPEADLTVLAEVIEEYERAPHGQKQMVLAGRLGLLGISEGTFFRWRSRWGRRDYDRKTPTTRGLVKEPERLQWTQEIMRLKHSPVKGVRALTTEDAVSLAVQWGRVPVEAAAVLVGTYNRLARQLRFDKSPRRGVRWEAPYFNFLHQVDASGSEYFYPARLDGGEWILERRPRPMKNKPTPEGRKKLWYWGLAEDFSGCRIARMVVAAGESALDGLEFLRFAWGNDPAHAPVRGIPLILDMDNGVLARHHAVQRCAADWGINIRTHEPGRAQATGKVETGWKDFWRRFEGLFMRLPDWQTWEISLSELQKELQWFIRGSNQRDHRQLPGSKEEAWLASVRERGGLVDIDPAAFDTVFRDFRRVLDDAGVFDFQGQPYVVKEIQACPVIVYPADDPGHSDAAGGRPAGREALSRPALCDPGGQRLEGHGAHAAGEFAEGRSLERPAAGHAHLGAGHGAGRGAAGEGHGPAARGPWRCERAALKCRKRADT